VVRSAYARLVGDQSHSGASRLGGWVPTGDALLPDNGEYFKKFNRHDFMFDHGLAHHPLFELSSLKELARRRWVIFGG
jgi:hypothetical protein